MLGISSGAKLAVALTMIGCLGSGISVSSGMVILSAFFGALPLILQTGSNAQLNRPLGIAICGGLLVSQILTLYTTPVVYVYLDRFGSSVKRLWKKIAPRPSEGAESAV